MTDMKLSDAIKDRVLVLDGAMGTMLQKYGMKRGECAEDIVLNNPDTVRRVHREYLEAGADIITTDTFNATSVSLEKYGLAGRVREIARRAAEIAREEADRYDGRFVAGSIGPTSKSASIATDIEDMSRRSITFDELFSAYAEEIRGLSEGGADLLILETFFDSLNAKAALSAAETVFSETGRRLPVITSATLMNSGRLLSGQTLEAYFSALVPFSPLAVSLNCSFGAAAMLPYVEMLSKSFPGYCTCAYPNAGLPNADGGYDQTPEEFAAGVEEFLRGGFVNIAGGCCGTTPAHIGALAGVASKYSPRVLSAVGGGEALSGLEVTRFGSVEDIVKGAVSVSDSSEFAACAASGSWDEAVWAVHDIVKGAVSASGSSEFLACAASGSWDEAVWAVHDIVDAGAAVVDVCIDGMADDVPSAMSYLLRLMGADPVIAAAPLMITSSSPAVIGAGLKVVPGRCAVRYAGTSDDERRAVEALAGRFGCVLAG